MTIQPPTPDTYSLFKALLNRLHQRLEASGPTPSQFAHAGGFTLKQWQDWQFGRLQPALVTLDQMLLANRLVVNFELDVLAVYEDDLRTFLAYADQQAWVEQADASGNTQFISQAGERRAVILEKDGVLTILVTESVAV